MYFVLSALTWNPVPPAETSGQIHLLRMQRLTYGKLHQYVTSEGITSYR